LNEAIDVAQTLETDVYTPSGACHPVRIKFYSSRAGLTQSENMKKNFL